MSKKRGVREGTFKTMRPGWKQRLQKLEEEEGIEDVWRWKDWKERQGTVCGWAYIEAGGIWQWYIFEMCLSGLFQSIWTRVTARTTKKKTQKKHELRRPTPSCQTIPARSVRKKTKKTTTQNAVKKELAVSAEEESFCFKVKQPGEAQRMWTKRNRGTQCK